MRPVTRFSLLYFLFTGMLCGTVCAQEHPPIRQHPDNPAYFQWRGGIGVLITSAEHYGAVLNADFDYETYLDTLRRDGMNYTRIFPGSYVEPQGAFGIEHNTLAPAEGRFIAPFKRSDVPGYAGGGNKFDLSEMSEEYLERLTGFVRTASDRGIVVEVTLFSSTYSDQNWAVHPFNPANNIQNYEVPDWKLLNTTECPQVFPWQERYVRGIVTALAEFDNIFYEIQNEPWADNHRLGEKLNFFWTERDRWPNAVEIPLPRAVAWQAQIAEVIREAEAGLDHPHLIAQNVANFRLAVHDDDLIPGVDLINFHYAYPEAVRWNRGHKKIIGFDESGFAGREDLPYLRQAWRIIMSGGALFNNLDYSFSVGHEDGRNAQNNAPGGGSGLLRKQLSILSRFVHSLDLTAVKPDNGLVIHSPGAACLVLSQRDEAHAIYLEGRGGAEMTLDLAPGTWNAEWVRVTGGMIREEDFEVSDTPAVLNVPDFDGALALRLTRRH